MSGEWVARRSPRRLFMGLGVSPKTYVVAADFPLCSVDGCGAGPGLSQLDPARRLCAYPGVCASMCCLIVRRLAAIVLRNCGLRSGSKSRVGPVAAVSIAR